MIKGLEALKNIKREAGTPYFSTLYDIDMWREDFGIIEKELKALEIILNHKLLNYVLKNPKCAKVYNLSNNDIKILKELCNDYDRIHIFF